MLYIFATTEEDVNLSIHTTPNILEAIGIINKHVDPSFLKSDRYNKSETNPEKIIQDYYSWVREDNDNMTDYCIEIKVIS